MKKQNGNFQKEKEIVMKIIANVQIESLLKKQTL